MSDSYGYDQAWVDAEKLSAHNYVLCATECASNSIWSQLKDSVWDSLKNTHLLYDFKLTDDQVSMLENKHNKQLSLDI